MTRHLRPLAQFLLVLASIALLAFVLRSADLPRAVDLVRSFGRGLPLLLLPQAAAVLLDGSGWWLALASLPLPPRFLPLVAVRVACDALLLGLPYGAVVSESLQPYLLKRRCGLPLESAIVATVARKLLVVFSHGTFLALATLLAWPLVDHASRVAIGRGGLSWLLLAAALVLVVSALASAAAAVHGRLADRLRHALDLVGGRWLGAWLRTNAIRFRQADEALSSFLRQQRGRLGLSVLLYLAGWLARAVETYVFLAALGAPIPLAAAMVVETALILVRALAMPVPGGLGVQDLGYVLALRTLGVADVTTVATAFVLLKRGKDLFWVLLGLALLSVGRRRREAQPAALAEALPAAS